MGHVGPRIECNSGLAQRPLQSCNKLRQFGGCPRGLRGSDPVAPEIRAGIQDQIERAYHLARGDIRKQAIAGGVDVADKYQREMQVLAARGAAAAA